MIRLYVGVAVVLVMTSVLTDESRAQLHTESRVTLQLVEHKLVDESYFDAYLLSSVDDVLTAAENDFVQLASGVPCDACLPPSGMPLPPDGAVDPSQPSPPSSDTPGAPPAAPPQPTADFGGGFQGGTLLASRDVPAMFGDFFGNGGASGSFTGSMFTVNFTIPDAAGGGGGAAVGRQKLAENTSPVPRDRVFLNYSYFDNVPIFPGGVDVHRFTPGFEKTFLGDLMSLEVRVPVAVTLSNHLALGQSQSLVGNTESGELGNLTAFLKGVLWEDESTLLTAGIGAGLPTADDFVIASGGNVNFLEVRNDAVHILPFIGGVYAPNDRFFSSMIVQLDVDANGSRLLLSPDGMKPLEEVGVVQDRTYLFVDAGIGYWLMRDPSATHGLSGLASVFEVHYNQSVSPVDTVTRTTTPPPAPASVSVVDIGRVSLVNLVVGLTANFANATNLQVGYVIPAYGKPDQQFDGELRFMFNWLFGRTANRFQRTPVFR